MGAKTKTGCPKHNFRIYFDQDSQRVISRLMINSQIMRQKMRPIFNFLILLVFWASVSYADQSSSKKSSTNIDSTLTMLFGKTLPKKLNSNQAAQLASELANVQSDITFHIRPFSASNFNPVLNKGRWHLGSLDVAALNGYSSKVSFDLDGRDPKVDIYFSQDSIGRIRVLRSDRK
jgi:hypothetical protein